MDDQWIPQGFLMDYDWISNGEPMDSKWIPLVFLMDFEWMSSGFVTNISIGFQMDSFDLEFIWVSSGFQIVNNPLAIH